MQKNIEVRFGGDDFLKEVEKLSYTRYLNRILSGFQEDITSYKGYITVNSKKGAADIFTFVSNNENLNKRVNLKLFNSPPFQS